MYLLNKKIVLILIPFIWTSCMRENNNDCGIYLEFIFDHNMEYADAFHPHIHTVDVFIFDRQDRLVLHKHTHSDELLPGKQMHLTDDLPMGTYKIITLGGLSEQIAVKSSDPDETLPSRIDRLIVALERNSDEISSEFPHSWFGETVVVNYQADRTIWPVRLIRNTNKFTVLLQNIDTKDIPQEGVSPYTFEIIAPEPGVYDYMNTPVALQQVSYYPFLLTTVDEPENTSIGRLNTMRLLERDAEDGYQLVVRKTDPAKEKIWSCDLIRLLGHTKPLNRPDGTGLPLQEYLDRQGEWNIIIVYREIAGGAHSGFLALSIEINGWIILLKDIEI